MIQYFIPRYSCGSLSKSGSHISRTGETGLTLSITGALVGEFVSAGGTGLGGLLLQAQNQINTALLFATLVVLAVLAALYYGCSWLLMKLATIIY